MIHLKQFKNHKDGNVNLVEEILQGINQETKDKQIDRFVNEKILNISHNSLTAALGWWSTLSPPAYEIVTILYPNLLHLNMSKNNLNCINTESLVQSMPQLEWLDIHGNHL